MEKNANTLSNFCESHSKYLKINYNQTVEDIQSSRKTVEETTTSNDTVTTNMLELLDQMKLLVTKSKSFNETAKGISNALQLQETRIQTELNENLSAIDDFKSQMSNEITAFDAKLTDCDVSMKTIHTNVNEMIDVNNQKEDRLVAALTEMDSICIEHNKGVSNKVDDLMREVIDTFEMTKINIDGALNNLIDDATHEQGRIDNAQHDLSDLISMIESNQGEYTQIMTNDIEICANRLRTFQTDELRIYSSSGQTPSKRDFVYPKCLAKTSPHAKIIKEFWETHNASDLNCSAILPEVIYTCDYRLLVLTINDYK